LANQVQRFKRNEAIVQHKVEAVMMIRFESFAQSALHLRLTEAQASEAQF